MKNNYFKLVALGLMLILFNSCKNELTPEETAKKLADELSQIDSDIKNGVLDSISGNSGKNYKYWYKNDTIYKVMIADGDGENWVQKEYFYLNKDANVFAYNSDYINFPDALDYKLSFLFDNSKVVKEEYWFESKKKTKSDMEKILTERGYTIDDIIKDNETKKILGFDLTINDIAKKYGLGNYLASINEKKSENNTQTIDQEEKILYFENKFGPYEHQKMSYELIFKGDKIDILYTYANNPSYTEKAQFKNGKIITEYGCSDCFVMSNNELCIPNPETGETECFTFIKSKSTHDIDAINSSKTEEKESNISSLSEIRGLIISGNKRNMKKHLGEADEVLGAFDYMLKYHNWKSPSVYATQRLLYSDVYLFENICDRPVVVIYNYDIGKVFEVMYKDDIKSFEDVAAK